MTKSHVSAESLSKEVKRLILEGKIERGKFPKDRQKIHAYCKRHNVASVEEKAKGGQKGVKTLWDISGIPNLPSEVRTVFGCEAVSNAAKAGAKAAREKREEVTRTAEEALKHKEDCLAKFNGLPGERQTAALAKHEVLLQGWPQVLEHGGGQEVHSEGNRSAVQASSRLGNRGIKAQG